MSDEIRYLAEENYKQIMEGMSWFLLTAHYKMQKEKWFEDEIVKLEAARTYRFEELLSLSLLQKKMRKHAQKRTKSVAKSPFSKGD